MFFLTLSTQSSYINPNIRTRTQISAPSLQECTNSHTRSLSMALRTGPFAAAEAQASRRSQANTNPSSSSSSSSSDSGSNDDLDGNGDLIDVDEEDASGVRRGVLQWPTSAEEYAVLALRMAREPALRQSFGLGPRPAALVKLPEARKPTRRRYYDRDEFDPHFVPDFTADGNSDEKIDIGGASHAATATTTAAASSVPDLPASELQDRDVSSGDSKTEFGGASQVAAAAAAATAGSGVEGEGNAAFEHKSHGDQLIEFVRRLLR